VWFGGRARGGLVSETPNARPIGIEFTLNNRPIRTESQNNRGCFSIGGIRLNDLVSYFERVPERHLAWVPEDNISTLNDLGSYFKGVIEPLLAWVREDNIGPALAALILIAGSIIVLVAFIQAIQSHLLIKKACAVIGSHTQENFAKNYNSISQDLAKIPKISVAWEEFNETIIPPKFDEQKNCIRRCENTVRPQNYFNLRELSMGPDFVKVFPSVFVGIGLSLTFLGLISALAVAVETIGVPNGSTESMQKAISELLKVSSAKFYASLFALFMSVLMTVTFRSMSWSLSRSVTSLNRALERGVRFLTAEELSMKSNDLLQDQLAQLQTFNTDLAMKIGEEVQSSLMESLAPVIQKLDDMGGDMAQQNINAIRDIALEVTKGIQGEATGSMDRVTAILDEVSSKLGGLTETLSGALSNFDVEFKEMLGDLKNTLKEGTDGVAKDIGQSMGQMSEGVANTATEVSGIIGGLTSSVESMANAGAEIAKQGSEELRRQVEAATKQASDQMAEAGKELSSGFRESTQGLVLALDGTTAQLLALEGGLVGLPAKFSEINSHLGTSAANIGEAAGQFDSATSGIRDLIEPLAQHAADTRELVAETTEAMRLASNQIAEASSGINSAIGILDKEISSQLERLDGSDEQLAKLLREIESSTIRVISSVNDFVSKIDLGFGKSVGILSESISDLEQVLEPVRKLSEQTREDNNQ
jgi:DNA anti-recombination protein RmuC